MYHIGSLQRNNPPDQVETIDKQDTEKMTAADFPATFSQFKEGIRPINEAKAP